MSGKKQIFYFFEKKSIFFSQKKMLFFSQNNIKSIKNKLVFNPKRTQTNHNSLITSQLKTNKNQTIPFPNKLNI